MNCIQLTEQELSYYYYTIIFTILSASYFRQWISNIYKGFVQFIRKFSHELNLAKDAMGLREKNNDNIRILTINNLYKYRQIPSKSFAGVNFFGTYNLIKSFSLL